MHQIILIASTYLIRYPLYMSTYLPNPEITGNCALTLDALGCQNENDYDGEGVPNGRPKRTQNALTCEKQFTSTTCSSMCCPLSPLSLFLSPVLWRICSPAATHPETRFFHPLLPFFGLYTTQCSAKTFKLRLRESASWLPLATGMYSRNLFLCMLKMLKSVSTESINTS